MKRHSEPHTEIHPFFNKRATCKGVGEAAFQKEESSIIWTIVQDALICGQSSTTPTPYTKIAAFDLDHTLIKPQGSRIFPRDCDDWQFVYSDIPIKLRKLATSGYRIVIFSNQNGLNSSQKINEWQSKIERVASAFNFSFDIFGAMKKDHYRKPSVGMYEYFMEHHHDVEILLDSIFYVGDAAGRPRNWKPKARSDHSDGDRKFGMNIKAMFYTPEEYFLKHDPVMFLPPAFDPKSYSMDLPLFQPTNTPFISDKMEIILFVGYPGCGKTQLANRYLIPEGYKHINMDTLKSSTKCIQECDRLLSEGHSCVIDNTNPGANTRQQYIQLACKHKIPIRCFWHQSSFDLSMHNNAFRASVFGKELVPTMAFTKYQNSFEEPTLAEGFAEIKKINFLLIFEKEHHREKWMMSYH